MIITKRILVITFYYEPDLGAGSFRNTAFVNELKANLPENVFVDVFTTMPNRYKSFDIQTNNEEKKDNVTIYRIPIIKHESGFWDQIRAFSSFFFATIKQTKKKQYDIVFASSSRLFSAFLGAIVARNKKAILYLDIRDIFREAILAVMKNKIAKFILNPFLKIVENFTYKTAKHINILSEGFQNYFENYKHLNFTIFPNGIDQDFLDTPSTFKNKIDKEQYIITYAGNIGKCQSLHTVIPLMAKELGNKYVFRIIGDGGIRSLVEDAIIDYKLTNIEMIAPVNRHKLKKYYEETDYLFLHLNEDEAFQRVIPSKIFEYGAYDKPILAGVSGFPANFIRSNIPNTYVFSPNDIKSVTQFILRNQIRYEKRDAFITKYSRKNIAEKMALSVIAYLN
jgi:hypothetical protein